MRFCDQCGSPLEENADFCIMCGASQSAYVPPPKKKRRLLLKIGIPAVAIIVIAILAVFLLIRANPLITTGLALQNLESEVTQRINSTPLRAVAMTTQKLENGTITLNLDYSNRWSELGGAVTITSNSETGDHALALKLDIGRDVLTAEAFLNRSRLAVGSTIINDNFYGITFSTFRKDIRIFGRELGMDRQTMDMLADMVELLEMAMNADSVEDTVLAPYIQLLTDFVMNLDPASERTQIQSGAESVNVRRIEYTITADDIITLLTDIAELMQNDDELRAFYNSLRDDLGPSHNFTWRILSNWVTPSYDDIMEELRYVIRDFGRELSGEITITFYIGSSNRLIRMESEVNMRFEAERFRVNIICDFGTSAYSIWVFTVDTNIGGNRTSTDIVWDYEVRGNRVITKITISTDDGGQEDEIIFLSEWSRDSGRFTLSYESYRRSGEIGGVFTYDGNDFSLMIDNPLSGSGFLNQRLDIEIIGTTENQIRNIDFINIDRWSERLLEDINEALWGRGFNLFSSLFFSAIPGF